MKQMNKSQLALVCGGATTGRGEGGGGTTVSISSGIANAAALGTSAVAVGGAIGADAAITAAGGLGNLGMGAIPANSAVWGGYVGAGTIGYIAGSYAYEHSETVQNVAQAVVGFLAVEVPHAIYEGVASLFARDPLDRIVDDGVMCYVDNRDADGQLGGKR